MLLRLEILIEAKCSGPLLFISATLCKGYSFRSVRTSFGELYLPASRVMLIYVARRARSTFIHFVAFSFAENLDLRSRADGEAFLKSISDRETMIY